jgi:transcriptional regulator with XRE-family HTH domain
MNLFAHEDYKEALRARIREVARKQKGMSLKRISEKISIQYTYLSKVLNDEKSHLGEDHLFALCQLLQMLPDEVDFIFLLRSQAMAQDPNRKTYLQNKLNLYRRKRELTAEIQGIQGSQLSEQMGYLFDPLCVVVHVSLFIKEYAANPRRLCVPLGISVERLQMCLKTLSTMQFIELQNNGTIVKVMKDQIHYGTDHPLMRVHQHLLRSLGIAQQLKANEQEKHSFMTTFSTDAVTVKEIQERFQSFLKEIEERVNSSRAEQTYQLNFDIFRWC